MTPGPSARRVVVAALTERMPYKIAAVFFAVVLWLVVSGEERAEAVVPVRFSPFLDSSLGPPRDLPRVQAVVEGRGRDLLKLYANPPVLRPVIGPGTARMVELRISPRDVRIPDGAGVVVRDVQPRRFRLRFDRTPPVAASVPGSRPESGQRDTARIDTVGDTLP